MRCKTCAQVEEIEQRSSKEAGNIFIQGSFSMVDACAKSDDCFIQVHELQDRKTPFSVDVEKAHSIKGEIMSDRF